jgi:hypothetical protein
VSKVNRRVFNLTVDFFFQVTHAHFWLKRKEIEKQCEEWIADMEKQVESDPKGSKAVAVSLIVLKVECHNVIDCTMHI